MQVFSEAEVRRLLSPQAAMAAMEQAFRRDYRATAQMPPRVHLRLPQGGVFLVMPCHDPAVAGTGVKLVTVLDSPPPGSERIQAHYCLFDPATGALKALLAANYLTDIRTAATSAVATRFLARPDAATLGLFGSGRQAWAHLLGMGMARDFRRVLVCGSSPARSQEFAQRAAKAGIVVEPADAAACAAQSDVICTCTTSATPLFDGSLLRPGTHLNLVGAFRPETREVDEETIARARVNRSDSRLQRPVLRAAAEPQCSATMGDLCQGGGMAELMDRMRGQVFGMEQVAGEARRALDQMEKAL